MSDARIIHAAGAVLWRPSEDGGVHIAVVHRPRYDDWSLPKGKLDPGETPASAAAREVAEETGFAGVLSRYLGRIDYPVPGGEPVTKVVDYYCARAESGRFEPNDETDALRWCTVAAARELLSYPHDGRILDEFDAVSPWTSTVLLVRHAKAGKRSEWNGDDDERPLSPAGLAQQSALRALLALYGPRRVLAAPRVRCEQTVAPVAADLGIDLESEPALSEEEYRRDPDAAVARFLDIVAGDGPTVVCSQGGVIPDLVARLSESAGVTPLVRGPVTGNAVVDEASVEKFLADEFPIDRLPVDRFPVGRFPSRKGSVWTLTFQPCSADSPPKLVHADYVDAPDTTD